MWDTTIGWRFNNPKLDELYPIVALGETAENITDEIAALRARYDIPYLFFHDSVFTLNRKRTVALCESLIRRDLIVPFACQTRGMT